MGIGKDGYYTSKDILAYEATYNIVYGERGPGKSFDIKRLALTEAYKTGEMRLGLIRRFRDDITTELVTKYFIERDVNLIEMITKKEFTFIDWYRGYLWFARMENDKIIRGTKCGEVFALSIADKRYKSTGHPGIKYIVLEEALTSDYYLPNEPKKLMQLVSTIARKDSSVRVFLIGNTVSRVCPYFKKWALRGIRTQKPGTIDLYTHKNPEGDDVKIAVEYVPESPLKAKIFFGSVAKSITGGAWETDEHPTLPDKFKNFEIIYQLTYKSNSDFDFSVCLLSHILKGYIVVYVYPSKTVFDRVVSAEYSSNPLQTPTLRRDIPAEALIHNSIIDNKIVFSDNLTAEDFYASIKTEAKYPF